MKLKSSKEKLKIVVKVGGSALKDEQNLANVVNQIAALSAAGHELVVVHGGGPHITQCLLALGVQSKFTNGLRVTDDFTLMAAFAALGQVNTCIVDALVEQGLPAAGLHAEPDLFICEPKTVAAAADGTVADLGWVGEIVSTNAAHLHQYKGSIVVVSPIGWDKWRNKYNINADDAAFALATAAQCDLLVFLSDVPGVKVVHAGETCVLPQLDVADIEELLESGQVTGGMIPKLKNCAAAIHAGVKEVCIIDGREDSSFLKLVAGNLPVGTTITNERYRSESSPYEPALIA